VISDKAFRKIRPSQQDILREDHGGVTVEDFNRLKQDGLDQADE
jgi:hypothetical protein